MYEVIKAKARSIKIYQIPSKKQLDSAYMYISELKPVKKQAGSCRISEPLRRDAPASWRKPKENAIAVDDTPGPGSYNTPVIAHNKAPNFSLQQHPAKLLNKDNKFIILTQDDQTPEVGTYFKDGFFGWKPGVYPSYAFSSGNKNRNGIGIEKIADTPGPGNYYLPDRPRHSSILKGAKHIRPRLSGKKHVVKVPLVKEAEPEEICPKALVQNRQRKPIKPKLNRSAMEAYNPSLTLLEDTKSNIELDNKVRKEVKSMIENVLLIANNVSFNSHRDRFDRTTPRDTTPGPGHYNATTNKIERKVKAAVVPRREDRGKWVVNENQEERVGPGAYHKTSQWIEPSYNVTLPNNIIQKRQLHIIEKRTNILD